MILKIIIRSLLKEKKLNLFKLSGLVIAFLTIMSISIWIFNEISYDTFHSKADRIYRLSVEQVEKQMNFTWHFARTWQKWRRDFPAYFPEIEQMTELVPLFTTNVKIGIDKFTSKKAYATDSSFFKVFDLQFVEGNPIHAIDNKNTVVISQEFASKHFPGASPINKTLEIKGDYFDEFTTHTITGVYQDLPKNSHFQLDFLVNFPRPTNYNGNEWAFTYYLLKKGRTIQEVQSKITGFIKMYVPENQRNSTNIHFTALTDIHLKSHIEREIEENGDIEQVRLFILITIGIFLMVLINYINLNLVAYSKKVVTITIHKIFGAGRKHHFQSLIVESFILTTLALILSILLYNPFNQILNNIGIEYDLRMEFSMLPKIGLTLLFAHILFTLSGILPGIIVNQRRKQIFLTQKNSTFLLKPQYKLFNNSMLIIQFSISIVVIISGLVLRAQNKFLLSNQLGGMDKSIISVSRLTPGKDTETNLFCNEIKKYPEILDITCAFEAPTYFIKDLRVVECKSIPEKNQGQAITICPTDENFFNFFKLKLIAGRPLELYQDEHTQINYIINEKAVNQLGFTSANEAIGCDFKVQSYNDDIKYGGKIVGVVQDFHFSSLYQPIQATAYFQMPKYYGSILLQIAQGKEQIAIGKIKKTWDQQFPDYPMDYQFLNEIYKTIYEKDLVQGKLFDFFSIISIIISAIGLLGISTIVLIQRTKEVGIRKVNGACTSEILSMLNKGYVLLIIFSSLVAYPFAWYLMNKWLENFAYKISIHWWFYGLASIIALLITLLTVSWQSWRAASRNPVDALRYE